MSGETLLNNRYRLVAQQGSGGMSVIYRAVDQVLGRTVAIKILRPSLTNDPSFLEKFRNEARSIANLSHPNIVTVHDVGSYEGSDGTIHYIVMELVDGTDLKKIIREGGALSIERALKLGIQICAGIGFAHRSGIVHADVKPQNILVTKDDTVKVTDFGIAQALSDTQTGQPVDVVWGSPHYFAPEQARGERPTTSSDVYAIGIVLFEMLTGSLPYSGPTQRDLALAHLQQPVPKVSQLNPAVPESLSNIVYKVMSKEPAARYRMADQLGHVLQAYRDKGYDRTAGGPSVETPPPPPSSAAQTMPHQSPVPPPPSNRPSLLGQSESSSEPTQRYGAAPVAPQYDSRPPQPVPSPSPSVQPPQPLQQRYTPPPMQPVRESSGPYTPAYPQPQDEEVGGLDGVTIVLAILAFMAVACLIPLYIAVFMAWNG